METGFEDPNKVKPENESSAETDLNTAKLTKAMANHSINDSKLNTDLPDFEYDEDMNSLVAEEYEFKEDESDLITIEDAKIGAGQLTSDNLIDEDFEAELGGANSFLQSNLTDTTEQETDKATAELKEHIARYDIVNVCGSDLTGRHIIVLSACNLPDNETLQKDILFKSHQHFFDTLLEVLVGILERYVESEYTLVYFHYGLKSTSQPSFNWLAKVYRMLDRKFKKNLKALYVVHPSMLFKILWQFIRPLISSKFNKKVTYCRTLAELAAFIDLSILKIPEDVKLYDHQLKPRKSVLEDQAKIKAEEKHGPYQQFKVSLEQIASNNKGDPIPLCVKETIIYLRKHLDEEGIFRKSGALDRIKQIQYLYNYGEPVAYDQYEFHVAACVLKAFVRELPESLLNESIFNEMMSLQALDVVDKVEVTRDLLSAKLPKHNYTVLNYLIEFLNEVTKHSAENKMDARNLSYVFGPNFLRKNDDPEYGLMDIEKLNNFVELLIKYHSDIFISNVIKD